MKTIMTEYHLVFSILFMFSYPFAIYSLSSSSAKHPCSPDESLALLRFKNSFSIDSSTVSYDCRYFEPGYPRTEYWKEGSDCCSWDGVTCDQLTGHVTALDLSSSSLVGTIHDNNSLFLLHHLQRLNLACNDFSQSDISFRFGGLLKLRHLDLSSSNFSGLVPAEISYLSKLVSLRLDFNDNVRLNQHSFDEILKNVTELRHLHLGSVNMSSVVLSSLANMSTSLIALDLSGCSLRGKFPNEVFHHSLLQQLILSKNEFSGQLPSSLFALPSLELLDLSHNKLTGTIPVSQQNNSSLRNVYLGSNFLTGPIPSWLFALPSLVVLDLSHNKLTGTIPVSQQNHSSMRYVDLDSNSLTGPIPSWFFALPSLESLDLSHNKLTGTIPVSQQNNSLLEDVYLGSNSLTGLIPSLFFALPSLETLDLSHNKLTGTIPVSQQNNSSLEDVYLGSNSLTGPIPSWLFALPSLVVLDLSNNKLTGTIPVSQQNNSSLGDVYLGSNSLTGPIPSWFFALPSLQHLVLSNNELTSPILESRQNNSSLSSTGSESRSNLIILDLSQNILTSFQINISIFTNLDFLSLGSNMLKGSLVIPPSSVRTYNISYNKLTGEIPTSFCNLSSIMDLDLSHNTFSGTIPQCLDPQMENSQIFSKASNLTALNLNDNRLEGSLPRSLANCASLEIINIGNNNITDTFPYWLITLSRLQILVLRSNNFHGVVSHSLTRLPLLMLRIVDISHSKFTGILPTTLFQNLKAIINVDNNDSGKTNMYMSNFRYNYYYHMTITMKGHDFEMEKIFYTFTTIDFSNNQFDGSIPEVVGNLKALEVLNFSHNNLSNEIPPSLGNLTAVESLDLACNKLSGEIPLYLKSLTSLAVLNLSYNQLTGPIPQGLQFDTFNNDSYIGNMGLCGRPLSTTCQPPRGQRPVVLKFNENNDDATKWFWRIFMMGYGSGLAIGVSIAYMVFTTGRPFWIIKMYERLKQRRRNATTSRERHRAGRRN